MQKDIFQYIDNNYFTNTYLQNDLPKDFDKSLSNPIFEKIKTLYEKIDIQTLNEGQLETEYIQPILRFLDFSPLYQDEKSILGKNYKIDFSLFSTDEIKKKYIQKKNKANTEGILLFLENKSYKVSIDNKKVDESNPHFQLIRYMQAFKINYGFLTNGKFWRFYDISKNKANKVFFQIDLEAILLDENQESFEYFYHIFKKDNFEIIDEKLKIQTIIEENEKTKLDIEKELKEWVYGRYSIVKTIGQEIFKKHKTISLEIIFEQASIFTFRLLFIAYLEDKFEELFFKKHKNYKEYSLFSIFQYLKKQDKNRFSGYKKLKDLFLILDQGEDDIDIPLLNGGLFDCKKAELLKTTKLINNEQLYSILEDLLGEREIFKRDFKSLSVKHISNIYESLLDFDFKIATDEMYYVIYKDGRKEKDGYFDIYDYNKIKKKSILYEEIYKKGDLFFSNLSNSRKETASYYTPPSFTQFMVQSSIDKRLEYDKNILNLKILDNACGSGHFLVDALNYVTEISYRDIEKNQTLKNLIEQEKSKINKQIVGFNQEDYIIDELILLKRILLKKIIYGVDINPLAIEITRLSLWIDTFIFSTPLSFIEHHIKVGNSLIGSTIEELMEYSEKEDEEKGLFKTEMFEKVKKLQSELKQLANVQDTTKEEIEESKKLYQNLQPTKRKLNLALDCVTCPKIDKKDVSLRNKIENIENQNILNLSDSDLIKEIETIRKKYRFFHYEVEFAEVFYGSDNSGFHVIVGNPPWDKTKFQDPDFFSMYRSSYRTLNTKEKEEVRENILNYKNVQETYNDKKELIQVSNEYFQKNYPYNQGAGDNNLFRFFIERNLSLLAKNSNLTYLTPSALMYDDGSITLRKYIFKHWNLDFFYQFENRNKLFDIDMRYKFATFSIDNCSEKKKVIKTRFMQIDDKVLTTDKEIIQYSTEDVRLLSPQNLILFDLKNQKDLELLKRFYKKFQTLKQSQFIDFRNELHLTNDRDLFQLEKQESNDLILYEGKMIHQFNSQFEKPKYFVNKQELEEKLTSIEIDRLVRSIYKQLPESSKNNQKGKEKTVLDYLSLNDKEELKDLIQFDKAYYRLAFRMVASNTNERTLIFCLLPPNSTYGNSLYAHCPKKYILKDNEVLVQKYPLEKVLFIHALLNSFILDYIIRFIIDMNVNKTYLMRLPVPNPTETELQQKHFQTLLLNSLKLTLSYNSKNFVDLQKQFHIDTRDIPKTEKQRDMLKIQNDCIVAKIYDVTWEELQHIISPAYFKVFHNHNPSYIQTLLSTYKDFHI